MFVPYFSGDSESYIFSKLKVIFLVRRIEIADIFLFLTGILPFLFNFFWYLIVNGKTEFSEIFKNISALWTKSSIGDSWNSIYGYFSIVFIFISLFLRYFFSVSLWKKMKEYERKHEGFVWSKRSMYVLTVFVPFVSFITYLSALKTVRTEYFHKYNL